jgi:hypothetical protein
MGEEKYKKKKENQSSRAEYGPRNRGLEGSVGAERGIALG